MKIRSGFVSNSSSSSFVIHRSYITDKQVTKLANFYDKLVADERIYDDSGCNFVEAANYIAFNAHGGEGCNELMDLIKEMCITEDQIFNDVN